MQLEHTRTYTGLIEIERTAKLNKPTSSQRVKRAKYQIKLSHSFERLMHFIVRLAGSRPPQPTVRSVTARSQYGERLDRLGRASAEPSENLLHLPASNLEATYSYLCLLDQLTKFVCSFLTVSGIIFSRHYIRGTFAGGIGEQRSLARIHTISNKFFSSPPTAPTAAVCARPLA